MPILATVSLLLQHKYYHTIIIIFALKGTQTSSIKIKSGGSRDGTGPHKIHIQGGDHYSDITIPTSVAASYNLLLQLLM